MGQHQKSFLIALSLPFLFLLSSCSPTQQASSDTVKIWHWMTDRQPAFEELARSYESRTGTKVVFELYAPSDAYSQKVRAAAQGANLPDVFGILAEKRDFASFIKAGYIMNLTPFLEADNNAWKGIFFEKAIEVNSFLPDNVFGVEPGIYGVPIDIMTIKMVYNKKLLEQMGFREPPSTFDDFLKIGSKLPPAVQGLVSGWGEVWMIDCFANNYAFNIMGKDKVLSTIRGETPYTDPDWIQVFSLFKRMQESRILAGGIVTMVNKTAEQLFANEKAVFGFNGSWGVNVYNGMNPGLSYGVMLPPSVSSAFPMTIWGGAGSSFMVNPKSPRKDKAVEFLKWMTADEQQSFLARETRNLPANKKAVSDIPDILAQFAADMDQATHPNTWGISEFPAVIEAFDKGIQSIIIGEKTPEQVAQEVQKIKERELAKR